MPYGIYDNAADTGWVNVGTDHDTAAFAVESIRRWWKGAGCTAYPATHRLLITADAGGSNGYRTRTWKTELARLAGENGLAITVCHFPPGTAKWNRIEHRLFSHITMNWRGRPLTSHDVIVQSIAATTTSTGLAVHAELDTNRYPTGVQVTDGDGRSADHPAPLPWRLELHPSSPASIGRVEVSGATDQPAVHNTTPLPTSCLRHSGLTGMSAQQLSEETGVVRVDGDTATVRQGGDRRLAPGALVHCRP